MFSKRTIFVALMGLVGASAAKTSSFSVCTDAYAYTNNNSSGAATLYSCKGSNDPDLTDPVGSISFDCGAPGDAGTNQNGNYYCDCLFAINGWYVDSYIYY